MEHADGTIAALCEDDDVQMMDFEEEGELLVEEEEEDMSLANMGQFSAAAPESGGNQGSQSKNRRRKANKRKNKKRRNGPEPNVTDINRFVLDTCRLLRERKSYMVYAAVGCLGVSALSELVKEVGAIQSCGGQMTADGRRFRNGGGILWNILKTREPTAYKKIMKKTKEFEKQFKQQNNRLVGQNGEGSSQMTGSALTDMTSDNVPDDSQLKPQNPHEQPSSKGLQRSIHDRIRMLVSYDDLLADDAKTDSA